MGKPCTRGGASAWTRSFPGTARSVAREHSADHQQNTAGIIAPAEPHILLKIHPPSAQGQGAGQKKIHAAALAIAWTPVSCVLVSLR